MLSISALCFGQIPFQSKSLLSCYAVLLFWRTPERLFPSVPSPCTVARGGNARPAASDPTARHVAALLLLPGSYSAPRRCSQGRNRPAGSRSAVAAPSATTAPQSCSHLCETQYRQDINTPERSPDCS